MRILFFVRHYSYLRLFESAIEEMAARGHTVTLAADHSEVMGGRQMVERLAARYPNITVVDAPGRHSGAWAELARKIRLGLDYLRFLDPVYDQTPHLRARARTRAPRLTVALAESSIVGPGPVRAVLAALERGLPPFEGTLKFLRSQKPDVVLITPLVDIGSLQVSHMAAARRLGLRVVLPVGSWDHLSSKSLLRDVPERVIVWNESQRREAVDLHGVPADRVVITGAQAYDQWFGRGPVRTRDEFCHRVGLPAGRPFLLYVCSSLFRGTVYEPAFVERWIQAIRASADPQVRDLPILVRPHPARLDEWSETDLSGYRDVVLWGAHPVDDEAKADYFDSMYYCAGVVGVNTSAFIEAACVGKPVHAVLLPEISETNQEGTLHFHYLLEVNGGLLYTTRSLEEHVQSLSGMLVGDGGGDLRAARFVDGFVRPFGRDEAATPRFVAAVESAAELPAPAPVGRGASGWLAYLATYPVAAGMAVNLRTQPWRKRTRNRLRKGYQRRQAELFRWIKARIVDRMSRVKPPKSAVASTGPSALAPKVGFTRHGSKTLPGTQLPEARETRELVTVLGRGGRPIIAGPWLSETGFELLYWIPFLAWAKTYGNFDPERLVVVSRGGAAPWYRHITERYVDIFEFYTPDGFREANDRRIDEQGGRLKHLEMTRFDREILAHVRRAHDLGGAEVLHPSQMYKLFEHFWYQRTPMTLLEAFTAFSAVAPMAPDEQLARQLPSEYVAAKFYGNAALPDTPENRAFITSFLADLAEQTDVVLLNTGQRFDDHADFPPSLRGRVHTIEHLMQPVNNLAVQTRVIRGAKAFVGTYGGFSYLAPLCGTDTLAFYSHPSGFRFDHLDVAKRVFSGLGAGAFVELDLRAVHAVRLGFGAGRALVGR